MFYYFYCNVATFLARPANERHAIKTGTILLDTTHCINETLQSIGKILMLVEEYTTSTPEAQDKSVCLCLRYLTA